MFGRLIELPANFLEIIEIRPDSQFEIRGKKLYGSPSIQFQLVYYSKLDELSSEEATNPLLENYFDVYVNLCLVELYEQEEDELNMAKYEAKAYESLAQVKVVENRAKRSISKGRIIGRDIV